MTRLAKEEEVIAKCEYFVRVQLWPVDTRIDPVGWLANFLPDERVYAVQLLNRFMFFSELMLEQMLLASFQDLSSHRSGTSPTAHAGLYRDWRSFCDRALFTYSTGELENPTDSGHLFVRVVKRRLCMPQKRILTPRDTLEALRKDETQPVIFVDDFIGSGQQFVTAWKRCYVLDSGEKLSFSKFSAAGIPEVYYCAPLATRFGVTEIRKNCPDVTLSIANVLSDRYNALHRESIIWPEEMRATAPGILRRAGNRVGIPNTDGEDEYDWKGFKKLGLALAFHHGIPDATLGLLRWNKGGWRPLIVTA